MTLQAARHWPLITLGMLMFTGISLSATPQGVGTTGPQFRGLKGDPLRETREVHLRNIRQLTTGGTNAEAYFSYDGKYLIFQATRDGFQCDQIFLMSSEGSEVRLLSTGKGRTTCGYFLPGNQQVIYSSTHLGGDACPQRPNRSQGYVWPIYPSYQIFRASLSGIITEQLTRAPGYNAEATVSPDGRKMVFTSTRDGDLELYDMDLLTRRIRRLTHQEGYDGGAFYSPDSQWIVYRAFHPTGKADLAHYQDLLSKNLVEPMRMEIFIMRADGSEHRQITHLGKANFAPFWLPSGKRIIFSSNFEATSAREFELYMVKSNGNELERITFSGGFNSFPMFSPDGKKLVFSSNRNAKRPREINIFIADWIP